MDSDNPDKAEAERLRRIEAKQQRAASALRANLRRRKEQQKLREPDAATITGDAPEGR